MERNSKSILKCFTGGKSQSLVHTIHRLITECQDTTGAALGAGGHEGPGAPVLVGRQTQSHYEERATKGRVAGGRGYSTERSRKASSTLYLIHETPGRAEVSVPGNSKYRNEPGTPKGQKGCMNQSSENKQARKMRSWRQEGQNLEEDLPAHSQVWILFCM